MLSDHIKKVWGKPWVPPAVCLGLLGLTAASWLRSPEVKTVEVVREQVVYVDRVQTVVEYRTRKATRVTQEKRPDGTQVKTKEIVQEGGERTTSTRTARSTVEQGITKTTETSKTTVASISRYSLAASVGTGVLMGPGSQQVGLELGARLGNLPVFLTTQLQADIRQPVRIPDISLGVRYEF